MNINIKLSDSTFSKLKAITEEQGSPLRSFEEKKWSFVNIYHLKELRNIYLALISQDFDGDIKLFSIFCDKNLPFEDKPWKYRKVEEYINALRNFGLLNDKNILQKNFFEEKSFDEPLDKEDIRQLKSIYYRYFRFKEIHSWFVSLEDSDNLANIKKITQKKLVEKSFPLFSFSYNSRFTDAFMTKISDVASIYYLDNNVNINRALMRFWDVYLKWGRTLDIIDRFSLDQIGIYIGSKGIINCNYHILNGKPSLGLYDYIVRYFGKKKVFVPELIYKIAIEERLSIRTINDFIINEYSKNRNLFSLDNTSEIFIKVKKIKETESVLFPIYRDSYISHITIAS